MNKRQHKKKIKYIIDNIQKINLNNNEILVFRYDNSKYSIKSIGQFSDMIRKQISERILFVPKDFEIIRVEET